MLDFDFMINQDALILTAVSRSIHTNASEQDFDELLSFKNALNKKAFFEYVNVRQGTSYGDILKRLQNPQASDLKLIDAAKQLLTYGTLLQSTQIWQRDLQLEWKSNREAVEGYLGRIGINIGQTYNVEVTHPGIPNCEYLEGHNMAYGPRFEWPNAATVVMVHEALHGELGIDNVTHVIIELATNNDLNVFLNGVFTGDDMRHRELAALRSKIEPDWRQYLAADKKDLFQFQAAMKAKHEEWATPNVVDMRPD